MENVRKVIGVGESILDILFRGGKPVAAVPGGSSFNSIISVGRAGVPCTFVGYTGDDYVGRQTVEFLRENGVGTDHFQLRKGEKSAISLAFLGENKDASYLFYKEPPHVSASWTLPEIKKGDVMLFGSYYAACTGMRPLIMQMLEKAAKENVIVYYDLNFLLHLHERSRTNRGLHAKHGLRVPSATHPGRRKHSRGWRQLQCGLCLCFDLGKHNA